jgi:hypothetical protein
VAPATEIFDADLRRFRRRLTQVSPFSIPDGEKARDLKKPSRAGEPLLQVHILRTIRIDPSESNTLCIPLEADAGTQQLI